MSEPKIEETSLTIERTFKAPREKVFRALTDPAVLAQWYAPGPMAASVERFEAKAGGSFRLTMSGEEGEHTAFGKIVEIVPNERVVKSWQWDNPEMPFESLVTYELADVEGGTRVRLIHSKLPNREAVEHHLMGWQGILEKLPTVV